MNYPKKKTKLGDHKARYCFHCKKRTSHKCIALHKEREGGLWQCPECLHFVDVAYDENEW